MARPDEGYKLPPQTVVDIIDAKPNPAFSISPDRKWILLVERNSMPAIEDLARPMLRLAGMRIDPAARAPFSTNFDRSVSLRPLAGGDPVQIGLPGGAKISNIGWSHHSDSIAIATVGENGQQLWIVSTSDPANPKMITDRLTTVMGGFDWMPGGKSLLCNLIPDAWGDEPVAPVAPGGPNIQESYGNTSPIRTYQDLLSSPHDEALFVYYATSQLAEIDLEGNVRRIGEPAIYASASVAPNGEQILVSKIKKPFSYLLSVGGFPHDTEVVDRNGNSLYTVVQVPLAENIPIEGVRTGPRGVTWKAGEAATLYWVEALDGGDPNTTADFRDRLMSLAHPFEAEPTELLKIQHRSRGVSSMWNPSQIVVSDYDRDRRWTRMLKYDVTDLSKPPQILMDRSIRDRYGDPGAMLMLPDETGFRRIVQDGDWVYRIGAGASPQGDLPFVDRQNLETMETERLWRCSEGTYESPLGVIPNPNGLPSIITSKESTTIPPNLMLHDLNKKTTDALTDFPDPTPQIRGIEKQLVTYKRADGVDLSATLYLPANYQPGQRLPLIVWAYPMEFNDPSTAGQISGNPDRFVRMSGINHLTLVTQGYAVMDSATMPVVGDPETMNDTFVEQIVSSAQAAIDFAVEAGVADRNRVGVGGHSYGAFMTANLLAHCDLFKAGVARSGAYNRTLTPFGFQSERRDYWQAKDIYHQLSPFTHADKIKTPILLIHGENDNNTGTFPVQSQRMFQAIKGNGGFVRLVMLPYESHGYSARESVLHTQAEMIEWFDRYVKHAENLESTK